MKKQWAANKSADIITKYRLAPFAIPEQGLTALLRVRNIF